VLVTGDEGLDFQTACVRNFSKVHMTGNGHPSGEGGGCEEEEWHPPHVHRCQYKLAFEQPLLRVVNG